jgi:hypothetical protein
MSIKKLYAYEDVDMPGYGFYIAEDDVGWLAVMSTESYQHIPELFGRDNIFSSIEEIEIVYGRKLKLFTKYDYKDGKLTQVK